MGVSNIVAIGAGDQHSLVVKSDGTVVAWGHNNHGQVGDGTTTNRLYPTPVPGLTGVSSVAAGAVHSVALKNDGTIYAWGYNNFGQLGDGTITTRHSPVLITAISGIAQVGDGRDLYTIVLKQDGTVWAWGYNTYGQLGDGTTTNRYTPIEVIFP